MSSHLLSVTGMTCGHCKAAVEEAAGTSPGVSAATVDLDAGTVLVTGGDPAQIASAIEEAGYEARAVPSS